MIQLFQQSAWETISKLLCQKPLISFFNHIISLWERPRGAEAKLHFSAQPRCWSAICLGRLTKHSAVLPSCTFSNFYFLCLPSERRWSGAEEGKVLMHRRNFSHWQLLRDHSVYVLSNLALAAHKRVLISSFSLCIVHRASLVRAIALFSVVF